MVYFNSDLDPKSVDSFEELSQKFLEEFSQQKRYAKDPIEIHSIKRRQNEGLQAFMDWFKFESSHIKGVPPVLRISAFMHGHDHSELAKKLNDKIPNTVDEMFERVRAFIRGEVAVGSAEMTLKEILAIESVSFPKPPPLIGTPEKQNLKKFCDYHEDMGHNTNDCYQLKRQIEEAVASRKLAHLVKDIRRTNKRKRSKGRNNAKVKTQKMQSSDGRFFRRNTSSPRSNRSLSNYGKSKKKASIDNGISVQMFTTTFKGIQPNKDDRGRRRKDWVSYGGRSILFHPYAERIKELSCYTSEDDGGGLSRSKRTERGNILGRNSNKNQK
ncbi:hypothetical protein Tco_0676947 [Tanacetum coccineum]